jgi:hypothetical protein
MGMPEAGKTTFLAALWYCLTNSNKNKLVFKESSKNLSYLSDMCQAWAELKPIPRTRQGFEELDITLILKDENGSEIELTFPDISGETFQAQYDNREITTELYKYIKDTSGIILFINPMSVNEINFIAEVPKVSRTNNEDINIVKKIPLQVQLVELLQFVRYIRNETPVKLEILVSAWDVIEKNNNTKDLKPEEYIKEHLPLLSQYVKSNTDFYDTAFWGISAQGGFLDDKDYLLGKEDPCDRVFIIDNDGRRSGDITLPLCRIVGDVHEK